MAEAHLSLLQRLDAQLENFFAGWNGLSTLLAVVLIATIFAPLFLGSEPDIHPFLLGRQSFPTPVRQPGESAIYRNANVPHGYPLQSGLNIREEGAPVYAAGRDGDLRDIWKKIAKDGNGNQNLMSVRGRDIVEKRSPKDLTKELIAVGGFLQSRGSQKVLVMLHNSTELLTTIFAGAFYGFKPILVSPARYNEAILAGIVKHTDADALIAPAGLLSPAAISQNKGLKSVIWVVEPSSRHIDFTDADDKSGNVVQWHDLFDKATTSELPEEGAASQNIVFLQSKTSSGDAFEGDFVEFTSESIIAAVAAQIAALPRDHVLGEKDLVLSLDALTDLYPLVISLSGLWAGSSLALLSAAGGSKVDFDLAFATKGLTPTIVVASSAIMARARSNKMGDAKGLFASVQKNSHARSLAAGAMKVGSASSQPQLRLIYVSETPTAASDSVPLSGIELNDLRYLTRSRIIYSLVVPRVAGAVAQTNPLDYRLDDGMSTRNHFGPPLKSVEVKLVDTSTSKISDENLKGELVACGPAVVGKEAKTGVMGHLRDDGTLALV